MNEQAVGIPTGLPGVMAVISIVGLMLVFGIAFNNLVGKVKKRRPRFPSSILVVIGVIATSLGVAFLDILTDWPALLINVVAFIATGGPMIWGDLWRMTEQDEHQAKIDRRRAKRLARRVLKSEIEYGDTSPTRTPEVE